jgi:hypothetical protein
MANEIEKVNSIDIADIEKIMGRSDDDTDKLGGLEFVGAFVDPYSGSRLISQGTGARYSIWGGGYVQSGANWIGMDSDGYVSTIAQKNPFNDSDATHTGDMDWGKSACGVTSNGTTQISSGGFNSPSSAAGWGDWVAPQGPYVVSTIESLNSSTGGDAGEWGDVHYYEQDYPGQSGPGRFYFGMNAVGEDGSTGYYAGGSGRWSPGRTTTDEVWKISISSQSDSVDWGSNLSSAQTGGMTGMSGITSGGADTRWIMMGGNWTSDETRYFTFASSGTGSAHGDLIETHAYANGNPSSYYYGKNKATGSNGTRAVIMGGSNQIDTSPEWYSWIGNTIQYLTFASTSHAQMFGDTSLISSGYNGRAANGQYLEAYTALLYKDRPDDDEQAVTPRTTAADRVSMVSTGNASAHGAHLGVVYGEMDNCHNGGTGSN